MDEQIEQLLAILGRDQVRNVSVVAPTAESFPRAAERSVDGVQDTFDRLCEFMGVSRESVELWLYGLDPPPLTQYRDQWEVQGPAGLFTHGGKEGGLTYFIGLNVRYAADPLPLVAILAHELAHVRLFKQLAGTEDELEAERLTDLATVFLGLGLFTANSVILEAKGHNPWIEGAWSAVARLGYLVAPEYAYALAVFTWLRDERHPHWIGYLRKDVKVPFERTLAYFERSAASLERFQQTPPDP